MIVLALLAAFALGFAASEFYRQYRIRKLMAAQRALFAQMLWADHVQHLVRLGLLVEVGPGHYHRNPDLTDEEAQSIALANGLDIEGL